MPAPDVPDSDVSAHGEPDRGASEGDGAVGQPTDGATAVPSFGPGERTARSFAEVLCYELDAIEELRRRRGEARRPSEADDAVGRAHETGLVGLSFSGGGIRSASFNLGVATALARLGLLRRFDYLSLTSGGGYIGGWLLAWAKRSGFAEVERELARMATHAMPDAAPDSESVSGQATNEATSARAAAVEPEPVSFLRRFSNYLTPRVGALTADTWTFVTTYLRNLLLTASVLVLSLASLLLVPRLAVMLSGLLHVHWRNGLSPAIVLLLVSLVAIGLNLRSLVLPPTAKPPRYTQQGWVQVTVVLPLFLSAWMFGIWIWFTHLQPNRLLLTDWLSARWAWFDQRIAGLEQAAEPISWAVLAAFLYTGVWIVAGLLSTLVDRVAKRQAEARERRLWRAVLLAAPFAGALGGLLLFAIAGLSDLMSDDLARSDGAGYADWQLYHVNVWQAPGIVLVFLLTAFVHTGLMGRVFPEEHREWWSRLGAWLMIYAIAWLALFGIAVYGPIVLIWLGATVMLGLGAGWTALSTIGVQIARRLPGDDPGSGGGRWRSLVAALAPQVFIFGLLAAIALALHVILVPAPGELSAPCGSLWHEPGTPFRTVLICQSERMWFASGPLAAWLLCPLLLAASLFLSWRIDINQFSMHLFYRNRLIRTFLGASNTRRRPQAFTGFDPTDDFPLAALEPRASDYDGPLPLINTALNLVAGQELAWQERKAAAYVLSPGYSGFDVGAEAPSSSTDVENLPDVDAGHQAAAGEESELCPAGYRWTADYEGDGMTLGAAMGISGAAVSASMGAATRSSTAFLLTVFNARLGWWLGNPRHQKTWQHMGPRLGLLSLFSELFGLTTDSARYVYLSDGGHFDNLGLYELIRRRCRFVVVSDAGADPEYTFGDLGAAIRKCRNDFGVEVEIDTSRLRPMADGRSTWHCALGTIHYPNAEIGASPGTLLYLKASLSGDEPEDVLNYAAEHETFPHESTADQWFAESQFESYRKLGEHIALTTFAGIGSAPAAMNDEALAVALKRAWYPPSAAAGQAFTHHAQNLDTLYERLRGDDALAFLRSQLYPEWRKAATSLDLAGEPRGALPQTTVELDHGLYLCSMLLQLVENVYLDLALEHDAEHPDNRGWMNLFHYWASSPMVRLTWSLTAGTFGSRFQTWAERRLGLDLGTVTATEHPADTMPSALNETEAMICARLRESHADADQLFVFSVEVRTGPLAASLQGASLPFGFALVAGERFVYFRIQDHLRRMGLARRALEVLLAGNPISQPPSFTPRPLEDHAEPTSADLARFARMVRSVHFSLRQQGAVRHGASVSGAGVSGASVSAPEAGDAEHST